MDYSFEYFDKVFVISAKDNEERRAYVQKILSKLGINFEFYDAIMGVDLSDEEVNAVYDEQLALKHKTNKRPLSKPELGCALSHINIYKKIVSENLENAFIFEDDIAPDHEKLDQIDNAINELPEDWDIVYFGTLDHYKRPPLSHKLKMLFFYPLLSLFAPHKLDYKYGELWNLYPRKYSENLKRAGYHLGCHAYGVSRKGAEKFLAYHDKIVTPVDNMLSVMFMENEMKAFISKEMIFDQNRDFESAIENSRLEIRHNRRNNAAAK